MCRRDLLVSQKLEIFSVYADLESGDTSPQARARPRDDSGVASVLSFPLQAEIVTLDAARINRARFSQRVVMFLKPRKFPRFVERDRVLLRFLNAGEHLLAVILSVESGDDDPARKRSVGINLMRDFGGIGRHHQVPADERERGDVADFPVAHPQFIRSSRAKSHRPSRYL